MKAFRKYDSSPSVYQSADGTSPLLNTEFISQSFFGLSFGQNADIDIILDNQDERKMAEIRDENGRKERHYLFFDGESVTGKVISEKRFPKNARIKTFSRQILAEHVSKIKKISWFCLHLRILQ